MNAEDRETLRSIVESKQNGVMFHTKAMQGFLLAGLCGVAMLQQYQAIDEYYQFLYLLEEYVKRCGEMPTVAYREPDPIYIDPKQPMYDKINQALEIYHNYEKMTLDMLRQSRKRMSEDDGIVEDLIAGTKDEIEFITKLSKHVDKFEHDEKTLKQLDKWLYSMYKKKMPSLGN